MRRLISLVLAVVMTFVAVGTALAHWPVANRYSWVSQWYTTRHRAIDIASYCGTRIYPAFTGKVIFAGWKSNGGGYQVWTRTSREGKDTYAIYSHMKYRPSVVSGQTVYREKTRLGYVGRTGNATGCHLHFAVSRGYPWRSGSYFVNPWPYIDQGYWFPYRYR
jgi:murein DD-endopeptidase MepM/ murein hydrolase activator NlpD